jgi:hypothetical protein
MELLFESDRGFGTIGPQADVELATIDALAASAGTRPAQPDVLQTLGLFEVNPDQTLENARRAYGRGDLAGAMQGATVAREMWLGAAEVGRNRLLVGVGVALIVLVALGYAIALVRRIRRSRSARLAESPG